MASKQTPSPLSFDDEKMCKQENRVESFRDNWPFQDGKLSKEKMAEAGFYHISLNNDYHDCVRCFVCFKELEGWEDGDDPWEEHRKRKCIFAEIGKPEKELTVQQYIDILTQREINHVEQSFQAQMDKQKENIRKRLGFIVEEMLNE